jgi:microcystin-dependent protein
MNISVRRAVTTVSLAAALCLLAACGSTSSTSREAQAPESPAAVMSSAATASSAEPAASTEAVASSAPTESAASAAPSELAASEVTQEDFATGQLKAGLGGDAGIGDMILLSYSRMPFDAVRADGSWLPFKTYGALAVLSARKFDSGQNTFELPTASVAWPALSGPTRTVTPWVVVADGLYPMSPWTPTAQRGQVYFTSTRAYPETREQFIGLGAKENNLGPLLGEGMIGWDLPMNWPGTDDPTIGEIRLFQQVAPVPTGFVKADGQLLAASKFPALFALIKTTYGGDATSFAVPKASAPAGYFWAICTNGLYPMLD